MILEITRNGAVIYNHFAFASDDKGSNLSLTENENSLYIGQYENTSNEETTDPDDYVWRPIGDVAEEIESDNDELLKTLNDAIDYASNVAEKYIVPEEIEETENGESKFSGSIVGRVNVAESSVDILDNNGDVVASYGETAIIGNTNNANVKIEQSAVTFKNGNTELFKVDASGYYKEIITSSNAEEYTDIPPTVTQLTMNHKVVAVISITDNNGKNIWNFEGINLRLLSQYIDIIGTKSSIAFPLTVEYIGTDKEESEMPSYNDAPYMLDMFGNVRANGFTNNGTLNGFFGFATFGVEMTINASSSKSISIPYKDLMGDYEFDFVPPTYQPIGILGWKTSGTGNTYVVPYWIAMSNDSNGNPYVFAGFRNTSSTQRTLDIEINVLYGALGRYGDGMMV